MAIYAPVVAGSVAQIVTAVYSAVATGTTVLPYDDTIPQSGEGNEYMTLSITPKSATNILVIEAIFFGASSVLNNLSMALFQDATAGALAASGLTTTGGGYYYTIPLTHTMTAGTTSSTTFKIRAGGSLAGTTTFNGDTGNRRFGAITKSSIKITEIWV